MKGIEGICKIAGVQAEPVMFDKRASLEKALRCIGEAAAHHPNLIVFRALRSRLSHWDEFRLQHREAKRGG